MNANKGNFYFSGLQNIILYSVLIALSFVLISSPIFAQGSQGVIVRVTGFDPVTNVYNFSCITPAKTPASNMANEKYFDIDPNPSFYPKKYNLRSPDDNVTWHLDPLNFTEEVHSNAMYHIYCEIQNFTAPNGSQNLASEFHVDLRTTHNQKEPNIYVIDSEGPRVTLKCDPPPGVKRYSINWKLRERGNTISYPQLADKRIVNITTPRSTAGWDVVCDVTDKDTGKFSTWDMPIEFFPSGPAYIPTIEGCVANEPCTWAPNINGVPLNGSLIVNVTLNSSPAVVNLYINEVFKGTTTLSGFLTIQNITPGLHNLVIKKAGYEEISTLIPIASGKELYRNYSISENVSEPVTSQCFNSVSTIPANCTSGTFITDSASGNCRTLVCSNGSSSMQILSCDKPDNLTTKQFFELYKQSKVGTAVTQICIGNTCIKDGGYAKSDNFPICVGNATSQGPFNGSLRVSTNPNLADIYLNGAFIDNSGLIGLLTINNLIPGNYQLLVNKTDYKPNLSQVIIAAGQLKDVQINLVPESSPSNTTENNATNSTNTNVTTNVTTVCFSSLSTLPVNCSGGIIMQNGSSGNGRTIVCTNGTDSMKVQGWEKPDSGVKQYFDLYKQSQVGSTKFQICIGTTCIKDGGYAKSTNYPICMNQTTQTNPTPPVSIQNASLNITTVPSIADVYLNAVLLGTTDSSGNLIVKNITPGNYNLMVKKSNYIDNSSSIILNPGQNLSLNRTLAQSTNNPVNVDSSKEVFVRIVSADPATRTYTFSCRTYPETPFVKDWFIRPDDGDSFFDDPEENITQDLPSNEFFTYTFKNNTFYHISCLVVNSSNFSDVERGDVHIDLRNYSWNPQVVPLSGDGLTASYECRYNSSDYNVEWQMFNAETNQYSQLGTNKIITSTVPTSGNYDYFCNVNGQSFRTGLPIEYFDQGAPYFPDKFGIPDGIKHVWVRNNTANKHSKEPVIVRVTNYNSTKRNYSFSCNVAVNGFTTQKHWTIRAGVPQADALFDTESNQISYILNKDVLYHIGCEINNISNFSHVIRGDFHVERTLQRNFSLPEINVLDSNGLYSRLQCNLPTNITNYDLRWRLINYELDNELSQFNNKLVINYTLPYAGLWDYSCIVDNLDDSNIPEQMIYPIEYFDSGPAYVPNENGCVPNEPCPWKNQNNQSNATGTNTPPQAPTWLEPSQNKMNMDPVDFHIHVFPMVDVENDAHVASDFEIWDNESNQRVWSSLYNKVIREHIHNADGTFEGSLSGNNKLLSNHSYQVRARFYENAPINNISNWSEWRYFKTKAPFTISSNFSWTAQPGYKIEKVASNISFPVNIYMAPDLYSHLPEGEQPLLYVTQLYGQIGMIKKNGQYVPYATNLLNYPPGVLPGTGESGVVGLYVDDLTGDLFVSLVYMTPNGVLRGKVVKFVTNNDGNTFVNNMTILNNISVDFSHQVQSITRGPDGKLYLNTGDANTLTNYTLGEGTSLSATKDVTQLQGKVLRFNEDGSIPVDNPYPGTYTYAGGFRNPFGAAWRPVANELFVTNNGADSNDGIYQVKPGDIYGHCCDTATGTWHLWPNTTAPTQAVFNPGIVGFPHDTHGNLFVALSGPTYKEGPDPEGKKIVKFTFQPNGSRGTVEDFVVYTGTGYSAPIGLAFGEDGLYFTDIYGKLGITDWPVTSGNIFRVVLGDQTEDPDPTTTFIAALAPKPWYPKYLDVVWECKTSGGSGSYSYSYYFGDGQTQLNYNQDNTEHIYSASGTYAANCSVFDLITFKTTIAKNTITLQSNSPPPPPSTQANGSLQVNSIPNFTNIFLDNVPKGFTDVNGQLLLKDLLPQNYNLKLTKTNYQDSSSIINILSNQTLIFNVTLNKVSSSNCYSSVVDIPQSSISCAGGTITTDNPSGSCRTLICSDSGNSMQVMACNKPDSGDPLNFEMYKQGTTGSGITQICIGTTCIADGGYAKSSDLCT